MRLPFRMADHLWGKIDNHPSCDDVRTVDSTPFAGHRGNFASPAESTPSYQMRIAYQSWLPASTTRFGSVVTTESEERSVRMFRRHSVAPVASVEPYEPEAAATGILAELPLAVLVRGAERLSAPSAIWAAKSSGDGPFRRGRSGRANPLRASAPAWTCFRTRHAHRCAPAAQFVLSTDVFGTLVLGPISDTRGKNGRQNPL